MDTLFRMLSIAILAVVGPAPEAFACVIGLASPEAHKVSSEVAGGTRRGQVHFKILNTNCPTGGANRVKVVAAPLDPWGTLLIKGWTTNILDVAVPAAESFSANQVMEFTVDEGAGGMRFLLVVVACNGQDCDKLGWDVKPNNAETNTLTFP